MEKQTRPNISPAEMEVLRLLWQLEEATVTEVHAQLPVKRDVAYCTVQTLLRRLESKGHVNHHKRGKAYVFTPTARQDDVLKASVGDFVERLFGGDPIPLIQYLAEHESISEADIDRLRDIVKKKS